MLLRTVGGAATEGAVPHPRHNPFVLALLCVLLQRAGPPGAPSVGFYDVHYVQVVLRGASFKAKLLDVPSSPIGRLHVAFVPAGAPRR